MDRLSKTTIQAAIHAKILEPPKFLYYMEEMQYSEQVAAESIRYILNTLVQCHEQNRKPPMPILLLLSSLSDVADQLEIAANLKDEVSEINEIQYDIAMKNAKASLLGTFGLHNSQGAKKNNPHELIRSMAEYLCPTLDEDDEPIGKSKCSSINEAAKKVAVKEGKSYKTVLRAWNDYEKIFIKPMDKNT